ncbi:putative flavin-containing amine oxidase [Teratosphaeria nubilosa]|uniref:Amine oxidase n=1 Tax=Teratosphaeria nubilosa TaxID=161662 RepID=A0A6G1L5F0_9PEZI|nr:putative flavin-containing amine oxidase [Teratosphaeria nubilosa]
MSPIIKTIDIGNGPVPYFSGATVTEVSELIHISGQGGVDTNSTAPADYESQVHLALLNLRKVLLAAGAQVKDIVKLTIYVVNYDPENRKHVKPLQQFLGKHRPAVTLVPTPQLAVPGWSFEVEAVAAKNTSVPSQTVNAKTSTPAKRIDVVVIGAGLAGLTAAHEVLKAGYSCVVLEARDRVGGRTHTKAVSGGDANVELGAAWINDTNQSCMIGLARRFGLDLIEQNIKGKCTLQDAAGELSSFSYGDLPPFDGPTKQSVAFIRDTVEADCQQINMDDLQHPELDSQTFSAYLLAKGATTAALQTASVWTRAMLGQEPSAISALFFLAYCKAGGGLLQMRSDGKGGGQHLRLKQGTQAFSKALAAELPTGVLRLVEPVQSISQARGKPVVIKTAGRVYESRKVISAVPQPVLTTITFEPPLPLEKQLLASSYRHGFYKKVMIIFNKPFWIEKGYCGLIQSFTGPAAVIRDTSIPSDDKWVLTCFVAGGAGREWASKPQAEREAILLKQVSAVYGEPRVEDYLVEMITSAWEDEHFSGLGCPSASLPPGVLSCVGNALQASVGNVHFAGTETSTVWRGYMEGAVRSGERAGQEVIDDLSHIRARL